MAASGEPAATGERAVAPEAIERRQLLLRARMLPTMREREDQKRLWRTAAAFPFVLAMLAITAVLIWFLTRA